MHTDAAEITLLLIQVAGISLNTGITDNTGSTGGEFVPSHKWFGLGFMLQ